MKPTKEVYRFCSYCGRIIPHKMEEELNYISEKIEDIEESINVGLGLDFTQKNIKDMIKEKNILESILNAITISELT